MRFLIAIMFFAIGIVGAIASGCNRSSQESAAASPSPFGKVAIIDLDRVARLLRRDVQIVDAIKIRESSLDESLNKVREQYRQQLAAEKKKIGDEPTHEQTKKLQSISQEADAQFQRATQEALSHLVQHRKNLIRQFRAEVHPVAQDVAEEFGLSIVVTKNDDVVFTYGLAVDITDEVVKRLRPLTTTIPADEPPAFRTAEPPGGRSLLH